MTAPGKTLSEQVHEPITKGRSDDKAGEVHPARYDPDDGWFVIGTTGKVVAFIVPPPYEKALPRLPLDTGGVKC
jgi:hypothetical protein